MERERSEGGCVRQTVCGVAAQALEVVVAQVDLRVRQGSRTNVGTLMVRLGSGSVPSPSPRVVMVRCTNSAQIVVMVR